MELNKSIVIQEIDALTDSYCTGCFVKRAHREERGKTGAHRFCITQCSVGKQLQFLGREMNKLEE